MWSKMPNLFAIKGQVLSIRGRRFGAAARPL
jgi:hypothetical protein